MKHFVIRTQLLFVSIILLVTFGMMMAIVMRYNSRWDLTKEKVYSLSEPTLKLLEKLDGSKVKVTAFYPKDDPARDHFEVFLKECQLQHSGFQYFFFDPDRVPSLTKQYSVKELYTVIIEYDGRQERIVFPTEETFSNALLRLANPKQYEVCFVQGHGEAQLDQDNRSGYRLFKEELISRNYLVHEIILARDKVPDACNVVTVAGPHRDLDPDEFGYLKKAFLDGKGVFFLIDPMDPGAGASFRKFLDDFGIVLGEDVLVDKMSRMVGGDFLVPLVNKYVIDHLITNNFEKPTFFPVARSVQPSSKDIPGLETVPLALTGSGSWAEVNLEGLEKGEAVFEAETDLSGPIPIAVAVEETEDSEKGGRLVTIGDSDFLTNAYVDLSGNRDFALNAIQWLAKDDRFISIHTDEIEFQPLFLTSEQRVILIAVSVAALPILFFVLGLIRMTIRKSIK